MSSVIPNVPLADAEYGMSLDSADNVLITGDTSSSDLPTPQGLDTTYNGGFDAFVGKVTPFGKLAWATFLGGSGEDFGVDITADAAGNVLITGPTLSTDFPTLGNFAVGFGGETDAFVAKVSPSCELIWSTFLGGSAEDRGWSIAVDRFGDAFVAGMALSTDFPTPNGFDTTHGGGEDGFLAKVSSTGQLAWGTFLGEAGTDRAVNVGVDSLGNALITGYTTSAIRRSKTGSRSWPLAVRAFGLPEFED